MIVASQTRQTSMKALALLTITAITSITATNQDISYTEMSAVLGKLLSHGGPVNIGEHIHIQIKYSGH